MRPTILGHAVRLASHQIGEEFDRRRQAAFARAWNRDNPDAMPLAGIQYFCRGCGHHYLHLASAAPQMHCPRCFSSWFAVKEPKCAVNF